MTQETKKSKKGHVHDVSMPLDFSFMSVAAITDIEDEEPRIVNGKTPMKEDGKYDSKCLRLNNNVLSELKGFYDFISNFLVNPNNMCWIDLSFNEMTKIDGVFCDLPNLQILYLHANSINDIHETDKLTGVPKLRKLSLHGNPIAGIKNYRFHILSKIPQLTNFDMSAVTKADRATAATWKQSNSSSKKRSRKDD